VIELPDEANPVRLVQGDCLDVLAGADLSAVDAVVTDPPYGLNYDPGRSTQQGITPFAVLVGDDQPFDVSPWLAFADVIAWCLPQLAVGVPVGVGAWYVWDKVTRNDLRVRIAECEFAWHKRGTKTRAFRHLWSGAYCESESGQKRVHPTQKPVALMRWCLSFLPEGCTVLDPYMGSGTTGVACVQTGRRFIGIELDPGHFRTARRRIDDALGVGGLFGPPKPAAADLFANPQEPTP
jgi:DNA modification methylase